MSALLVAIRERIAEGQPCDHPDEWLAPQPLATQLELGRAESQLGFRLPELLRRLYTEVGNGGFGPVFGLLPLFPIAGADLDLVGDYRRLARRFPAEAERWPAHLIPAFYCGCTVFEFVDCRDSAGAMLWWDEGTEDLSALAERQRERMPSLERRLEMWLSGESPW